MIRYAWNDDDIAAAISAVDGRWLAKAAERTAKLIDEGRYKETSSIWSVVKPVYMRLQHDKCVFCERELEGGTYGPIDWDLEHFRPKSAVALWPDPARHPDITYSQPMGGAATGYYWLAYDLRNYAASCKVCNSTFKSSFFPVLNPRATAPQPVAELHAEGALLCYPLGQVDEDPEQLITYLLTTAVPKHADGVLKLRARVIIDFFGLNKREHLHKQRARMVGAVGGLLAARDEGRASAAVMDTLALMAGPHIPHAACVRAFMRLWQDNNPLARAGVEQCQRYGFDPAMAPPG